MDLGGLGSSNTTVKTPETEIQTPTILLHHAKPLSFSSNGVLKRHNPLHHAVVVTYKECLKNHAASLGGHAVDGCGEFMPSPTAAAAASTNPALLKCAACGCHRNFHRREPEETLPKALEYQSLHRHRPPPPPPSSDSPSPPPISSSAPHMLLALSTAFSGPPTDTNTPISAPLLQKKRFRTKFTQDQKDKMLEFADKVGWKIQKRDEELISQFCTQVGVERGVLKVWMHNNKNTLCKNQSQSNIDNVNGLDSSRNPAAQFNLHQESNGNDTQNLQPLHNSEDVSANTIAVNGSSSSS
nr:zinc-finger homeodomain protein 9-like [Ipomoea trifida]